MYYIFKNTANRYMLCNITNKGSYLGMFGTSVNIQLSTLIYPHLTSPDDISEHYTSFGKNRQPLIEIAKAHFIQDLIDLYPELFI